MKAFNFRAALLLLLSAGPGHGREAAPLPTVSQVSLRRYAGQWYEAARLPNAFQHPGETALAEYLPMADGGLRVINTAVKLNGDTRRIRGRAEAVPGSNNARLRVRFSIFQPVGREGNYWILALDPAHYGYAMVGTPNRKFLWILCRTPHLDRQIAERLRARAQALGFPVSRLSWDRR